MKPNLHSFKILYFSTKDNSCLQTNFLNIWLMDERVEIVCRIKTIASQGHHSHILMTGGGGGPSDFC